MVELVAAELEAAHQGADRAVARVDRDEGRLHLGQLRDLPGAPFPGYADDRAAADAPLRGGLGGERAGGELQPVSGDGDLLAVAEHRLHPLGARREHHRGQQLVAVGMVGECLLQILVARVCRQLDIGLGAAIGLAPVVLEHTLAQRLVGGLLVRLADGRVHAEAARIDVIRVVLGKRLADHLGDILRMK